MLCICFLDCCETATVAMLSFSEPSSCSFPACNLTIDTSTLEGEPNSYSESNGTQCHSLYYSLIKTISPNHNIFPSMFPIYHVDVVICSSSWVTTNWYIYITVPSFEHMHIFTNQGNPMRGNMIENVKGSWRFTIRYIISAFVF